MPVAVLAPTAISRGTVTDGVVVSAALSTGGDASCASVLAAPCHLSKSSHTDIDPQTSTLGGGARRRSCHPRRDVPPGLGQRRGRRHDAEVGLLGEDGGEGPGQGGMVVDDEDADRLMGHGCSWGPSWATPTGRAPAAGTARD